MQQELQKFMIAGLVLFLGLSIFFGYQWRHQVNNQQEILLYESSRDVYLFKLLLESFEQSLEGYLERDEEESKAYALAASKAFPAKVTSFLLPHLDAQSNDDFCQIRRDFAQTIESFWIQLYKEDSVIERAIIENWAKEAKQHRQEIERYIFSLDQERGPYQDRELVKSTMKALQKQPAKSVTITD
ncbi:hypothetical protein [Heliorestis convoluta]|uniref:Uncharacterized protein n=1 Tax=Heliorestis convoluta TaxID=356322 RepID=A0A5Q2N3J5_9FIRM|nr:hypothetical protein [Heliorestis convoluta]QGG47145.1 hypothetical protein FTV88_0993 [Heliorestis convoluta]